MEDEKQHEAAGQPATEALTGDASAPETPAAASGSEEAVPVTAGAAPDAPAEQQDSPSGDAQSTPTADDAAPAEAAPADAGDEETAPAEAASGEPDELRADAPAGSDAAAAGPADEPEAEAAAPVVEASMDEFELLGVTEEQASEAETDAATLKAVLEAIVYVLPEPVPAANIASALNQPVDRVETILRELMADTAKPDRGVFIREVAGGYQVATKPEHHEAIRNFVKNLKQPLKLSNAALETLAVIAYKQPVTAPEIMEIRGVQGVGVLKTLLDRKLITTAGRKNVVGKPILYKTTKEFLTQFGLNRLSELPTLKEFEEIRRQSISDEEVEEHPEADPSAPLLEQAAELEDGGAESVSAESETHAPEADDTAEDDAAEPDADVSAAAGSEAEEPAADEAPAGVVAESAPAAAAEAQPETPAASGDESGTAAEGETEENHG